MKFCKILKSLIEERNLTQKRLAEELHIAVSTLGGYVQGTSEPDFEMLIMFANYFSVSTDFLLGLPSSAKTDSSKEENLLRIFRMLTSEQQDIYIEQGKAFLKYQKHN